MRLLEVPHFKLRIQNGGRDGTRTHFPHRDRMESRLFEFTPELAPGAGLAPTHAASKAAELRLFNPGMMVDRRGLAPCPTG